MFKFFKKSKPKATPKELAIEIFKLAKDASDDVQRELSNFLNEYEKYRENENRIRDEIQWIPYACGVLAVFVHSDAQTTRDVINELTGIWKDSFKHTESTSQIYNTFKNRMDGYFTRFNRGVSFRDAKGGKQALMDTLTQALFDAANEGIYFFTDKERDAFDLDQIVMLEVEERKPWGMLEMHVRELFMQYFLPYTKHLEKFNWK